MSPFEKEKILLLGDPRLRTVCELIRDFDAPEFYNNSHRLLRALEQFRSEHGFGRAISAPQIGILQRIIAMNLGEGSFLIVNPELSRLSSEKFTLWDDCMSFPWLMVRLERHLHLDLKYQDERGDWHRWTHVDPARSELLQHEVDHLKGVLATDHAMDRESIIAREVYQARKEIFDSRVDYAIKPTVD
jgi:peptide deformylase